MTIHTASAAEKESTLKDLLASCAPLAIAYSGGVDSAYLADVAYEVLGDQVTLVLADSPSIPRSEVTDATDLAAARGWQLELVNTQEFDNEAYLVNDTERCFFCKSELFEHMHTFAAENAIKTLAFGAIEDDKGDYRPGAKAAEQYKVSAPLQDAGLFKDEIRQLSKERGLPTWNKASFACLASRFPTGTPITRETISQVEQAEEVLRSRGFRQYRVRHHDNLCRVEIDMAELDAFMAARDTILVALRAVGYRHVTLDLAGYRTGSTAG